MKQYIYWATDPMKAFAVPCVIGEDLWHDIAREVEGLLFDRIRIVNHLSQGVGNIDLRGALETWHAEQVEEHRA